MIVRELITKLGFKTDEKSIKKYEDRAKKAFSVSKKLALGVGAALLGIGTAAVKTSADLETLRTQFEVMLGSAEKANMMIQDLREFSVKTPFELEDLANASTTLLQFGVNAKDIMPTVRMLGDVAGSNRERFKSLALVFGQIQSTGRLMGQDLLQLINQGFNPLQVISKQTGKSVAVLKDEMSKGKISAQQVTEAFKIATSEGGLFFQNMQKQSTTFAGLLSTVKGALKDVLVTIGDALLPTVKTFLNLIIELAKGPLQELATSLSEVLVPLFDAIGKLIPMIVKVVIPILTMAGNLLGKILKVLVPIILKILPIALDIIESIMPLLEFIVDMVLEILAPVLNLLVPIMNMVKSLIEAMLPSLFILAKLVAQLVGLIVSELGDTLLMMLPSLTEVLVLSVETLAEILVLLNPILKLVIKIFGIALSLNGKLMRVLFKGMMAYFKFVIGIINKIISGFNKVLSMAGKQIPFLKTPKGESADDAMKAATGASLLGQNGGINAPVTSNIEVNVAGNASKETAREIGKAVKDATHAAFTIELKKVLVEAST